MGKLFTATDQATLMRRNIVADARGGPPLPPQELQASSFPASKVLPSFGLRPFAAPTGAVIYFTFDEPRLSFDTL